MQLCGDFFITHEIRIPTVDGSEIPNNHLRCIPNLVNKGINYLSTE